MSNKVNVKLSELPFPIEIDQQKKKCDICETNPAEICCKKCKCKYHSKNPNLFCRQEKRLVCSKCKGICNKQNHEVLQIKEIYRQLYSVIKKDLEEMKKEQISNQLVLEKVQHKKSKINSKIEQLCNEITKDTIQIQKGISDYRNHSITCLKSIKEITNLMFNKLASSVKKQKETQQKETNQLSKIYYLYNEKNDRLAEKLLIQEFYLFQNRKKYNSGRTYNNETFDSNYKSRSIILQNENKTIFHDKQDSSKFGKICGQNNYTKGKSVIEVRVDEFRNASDQINSIRLGVIDTTKKPKINTKKWNFEGLFYLKLKWDKKKTSVEQTRFQNKKKIFKDFAYDLKVGCIITIHLDMKKKNFFFQINQENIGFTFENLPEQVTFFAGLTGQEESLNKITLI
ncbi:e3 ubiquitin-protein ligase trim [Anaeramoeba flamelloides]|uniref:E3 ubiquitin-protein ligase trim n=1 Tax=Anaeramoeba flamelloides TaxID=1746091 RepID=A0ABQ8YYP5_9EUKA|nr:e3 ubiquitin-protein ligase trim [Anaeramoeba flamelloides]